MKKILLAVFSLVFNYSVFSQTVNYNTPFFLPPPPTTAPGGALNFVAAKGNYIDVSTNNNIPVGNSNYTIEAWIKPNKGSVRNGIAGWGTYGTGNQVNAFRTEGTTQLVNYWWGPDLIVNVPDMADGNWHHVVATFDGTTRTIYMDGTAYGSDQPGGHTVPNANNLTIGFTAPQYAEYFDGSIDEVRIWNRGLCAAELSNNSSGEISTPQNGLVLYYKLNQGNSQGINTTITTATDASGNGNTGTLKRFDLTGPTSNWVDGYVTGTAANYTPPSPGISGVSAYLQFSTSASSCNAVGTYNLTFSNTDNVSYSFSGATNGSGSGSGSGQLFNKGVTNVVVTATNNCGGSTTSNFTVTVIDNVKPNALTKNITVYLDATGHASITAAMVNNNSNDNCGPVTISLQRTGTICAVAAENNTATLQAPAGSVIKSIDFASYGTPNGSCGNFTLGGCNAGNSYSYISSNAIGQNSYSVTASNSIFGDPCFGTVKRLAIQATYNSASVANTSFDCSNIGANKVVLVVTDADGNVSTADATVTVADNINPTITAPAAVSANTNTACTATGVVLGTPVTADNCSVARVTNNAPSAFPLGATTVTWIVTDGSGNTATATQLVIVKDNINPTITAPAAVSATTNIACTATGVVLGTPVTADNCSVASVKNDAPAAFPLGSTTVTWTVTDASGNAATASQIVTVKDNIAPTLVGVPGNVTVECDNVGTQNVVSATDNCSVGAVSAYQYPTSTLKAQLIHSFAFENSSADSKETATGTNVGGVTYSKGIIGQAATFNGTGQYLNYGTSASLSGSGPFAISVWTKTSSTGETIVQQRDGGYNGEYMLNIGINHDGRVSNAGKVYVLLYNNGFQFDFFGNKRVDDGNWHHIVFEREGANGRIFIDGALDASATGPVASLDPSIGTYVGRDVRDGSKSFNGLIDELHIISGTNCPGNYDLERTWTVKDNSGNQTAAQQYVSVRDKTAPIITVPADITVNTDANICGARVSYVATATDNCSTVTLAYSVAPNTVFAVGTTLVTVTATDACGNKSSKSFNVTVNDSQKPVIATNGNKSVNNDAGLCGASVTVSASATDNCIVATPSGFRSDGLAINAVYPVGTTTITWNVKDANGNAAVAVLQTITVSDVEKPTITAPAAVNATTNTACTATGVALGTPVTADNCSVASVTNDAPAAFPLGSTTVTWTVTDGSGNTATATQIVTVTDNINPTITAPAAVNATTNTACTATGVALGSPVTADNCSVASVTNDAPAAFPLGSTTVTWTVTDASGNTATATQIVTVTDNINPTITAPAPVNTTTNRACTATGVALGSPVTADNCSVASVTNDAPAAFPLGSTTVTWTVTDGSGNTATATQIVTVTDNINPTITAPAPVNTTTNTACTATGVALGLPVTGDNCSVASVTNDAPAAFPLGSTTVTWTVTDGSGNTATATQIVTVTDNINPTITAPAPVNTTTNTACTATGVDLGTPVTADNCSVASVTNDAPAAFPLGSTTVTWTVKDGSGNTATATQTVTVVDNINPTVITQNIKVQLDANGKASITPAQIDNGSSDNCSISSYSLNTSSFTCDNTGDNSVTLTVTDGSGNKTSATATVTVVDNIAPIVKVKPATIYLDANGSASITTASIDAGSYDNCKFTLSVSKAAFDCSNFGDNNVILTATDASGNISTGTAVVTVQDKVAPIVKTQNITVQLDASGNASITPAQINNGSTDNCGIATYSLDKSTFNCSNFGSNTVTLTVTDIHGNVSTATALVDVQDKVAPVALAQNVVVQLDATGKGSTTAALVNNGSSDACGIQSISLSKTNFTCADFGSNTVTLTVTDIHNNVSTTTAKVDVQDNIKPVITCVPAQSFCANYGKVTTYTIPQVTSTDNCGVQSTSYAITGVTTRSGNGSDASGVFAVGTSTITWTVTDIHGNVSTCTTTVVIKPLPVASYVTTDANAFCNKLSLTASSTEPGSTYQWNTPAGTSASAASLLQLNSANADGVYTLYATAKGCRSEFPVTYTYAKQNLINNYTLLGFKELDLGINNNVQSGSVGVTAVRGQAELRSGVSVASPGAFVKAARIDIDGVVNAPIRVLAPANPLLPTMIYNTVSSTRGYPNYQMKTATTGIIAGNYNSMTIKAGSNVTLSGTIYGSITVEKGATVAFTQGVVNIGSLQVGGKGYGDDDNDNKKTVTPTTYSYINFTGNTSVLVSSSVYFGLNTIVNKGNMKVTFYVGHKRVDGKHGGDEDGHEGDFNDNDETSFTVVGGDTKVTANVYAPNGRLQVKGNEGNDDEDNWKWGGGDNDNKKYVAPTAVTYMTGMFIANQIESDARGVIWNGYDCGAGTFAPSIANQYVEMESKTVIPELTVKATPNPTTNYFMLNINSNDVKTEAVVRVVDGLGRPLDQFSHVTIGSSITFGQAYAAGYYFAEVTQGTQHKVVKLIKML